MPDLNTVQKVTRWVREGDWGCILCTDCRHAGQSDELICYGCPVAWRQTWGDEPEYWKKPRHAMPRA